LSHSEEKTQLPFARSKANRIPPTPANKSMNRKLSGFLLAIIPFTVRAFDAKISKLNANSVSCMVAYT
jgi:hypothetical protein